MSIIIKFKIFKNGINNWFNVALNMFILKKASNCDFKNLGVVKLKKGKNYLSSPLFRALVSSASKNITDKQITFLKDYLNQIDNDVIKVTNLEDENEFLLLNKEIGLVFESFIYGDYKNIPYVTNNESIIDIGANVGDTALYFANKGYNVFAFEALPHIVKLAEDNLELNPKLKNNITLVNKAVSCKNGYVEIYFDDAEDTGGATEFKNGVNKVKVDAITIDEIIKQYNIKPNILKMDCEGCESNIIRHSDLSMFSEIIFEYHTNVTGIDEEILINILKNQGFSLKEKTKLKTKGMGIIHMVK